jgi:hypothetical protein
VPQHIARLVAPLVIDYYGLVVDYFAYARVRVPRHVARPVTGFVINYSVRRNFLLRPH